MCGARTDVSARARARARAPGPAGIKYVDAGGGRRAGAARNSSTAAVRPPLGLGRASSQRAMTKWRRAVAGCGACGRTGEQAKCSTPVRASARLGFASAGVRQRDVRCESQPGSSRAVVAARTQRCSSGEMGGAARARAGGHGSPRGALPFLCKNRPPRRAPRMHLPFLPSLRGPPSADTSAPFRFPPSLAHARYSACSRPRRSSVKLSQACQTASPSPTWPALAFALAADGKACLHD